MRTWALSATIGNLDEAARSAVGTGAAGAPASEPRLITAPIARATEIRSLLPESIDGFHWAGHLGLRRYEDLVAALEPGVSTLLFTNTRNQAERWHQCLRYACPEMEGALALHHSAIDRAEREAIEAGVKAGALRWVVCTSSLDLGVDFQPVERVVQIGSAKNVARLLQRAGRSAHNPGGTSQVLFMPTHALELLELSALRRGLAAGLVEERRQPNAPIDVLLQHLTSLACGPGFEPAQALATVRSAWSYRQLSDSDWQWCLRFLEHGGDCLGAYPRYRKLEREDGRLLVKEKAIARMHRLHIGTITADRAVTVRFVRGAVLGHVEEAFIGRLKAGDVFFFAGRQLEFVRLREMTAQVKASSKKSSTVPAWSGGQMALSDLLSQHLRAEVDRCARALAGEAKLDSPELMALEPLLQRQVQLSKLPRQHELLVEVCNSREGSHLYAYPFEGRFVHEGLGFLEQAINLSELCRRRFRAIAQISGLVLNGYPGQSKSGGQLQISAALLFDVFSRHEPANRLLAQARSEVLTDQLDLPRITLALQRLQRCSLQLERTARPGPLAFPLLAERLNNRMSNESLLDRLQRLIKEAGAAEGR